MLSKSIAKFSQSSYQTIFPQLTRLMSCTNDNHVDVAIVGGGIIGYSTAYWLKREYPKLRISIIEKDKTYRQCSTVLSAGGLRQQFSEPENIQMSMFCAHVFSNMDRYFSVGGEDEIDIQFNKRGYLVLCSQEKANILWSNYKIQKQLGASVIFLTHNQISERWPWLDVKESECGVYGTDHEGWFDPWLLLGSIRSKVNHMGVSCIYGTLKEFQGTNGKLNGALIQDDRNNQTEIKCSLVVNAAGSWASQIAILAELATNLSGDDYPLFIKQCKRYIYTFSVPTFPTISVTPMIIDSSGVYFRKENSGLFTCGLSPDQLSEPNCDNLDVDFEYFDEKIWPKLYNRVPLMEALKVKSGWAGFYDYNLKDQNLIIGQHPAIENFFLCNGSSGHGLQHAIAIGRANMELILYGEYRTINLKRLEYNRFITNELIYEKNIY